VKCQRKTLILFPSASSGNRMPSYRILWLNLDLAVTCSRIFPARHYPAHVCPCSCLPVTIRRLSDCPTESTRTADISADVFGQGLPTEPSSVPPAVFASFQRYAFEELHRTSEVYNSAVFESNKEIPA
jgi:hypothetical protein